MFDYAQVQLLGRATKDAELHHIHDEEHVARATFTVACNIPTRRRGEVVKTTIYRRVMALGSFANYVADCQQNGGLKGRLINVVGVMADERVGDEEYIEITRVAPGSGAIKIMDRRNNDG